MRRCQFKAVFESPRSQMHLGFFSRIVLESEPWEEIYLTPLRPVRLLVWTRTRWGGSSSFWRFLGWDLEGFGGRDTDLRIDRWSSFVWPVGYAQANSETFISPLMWNFCQQWTEGGQEEQRLVFFLIFMALDATSIADRPFFF